MSVSSQLSSDGKTAVVRIVNHGAVEAASIKLRGIQAPIEATAVTMASNDLQAENTAAKPDHVAPKSLGATCQGLTVAVELPGSSYTVVTIKAA